MKDKIWHEARYKHSSMISRCYDVNCKDYKSYGSVGITVCDDWRMFANYEKWYRDNYYSIDGGTCVDKDLLHGVEYSPTTCVILPTKINNALPKRKRQENHTTGVRIVGKKFEVKVRNPLRNSENQYVGQYDSLDEATEIYAKCKNIIFQSLVDTYRGKIPDSVFKLLKEYTFKS